MSKQGETVRCISCSKNWRITNDQRGLPEIICPHCHSRQLYDDAKIDSGTSEPLELDNGNSVFFQEWKTVNPALDIADDKVLLTKALPGSYTVYDKNGNDMGKRDEIRNVTITSEREIFECTPTTFKKRNLFPRMPESDIECNWSASSVEKFIRQGQTVDPAEVFRACRQKFDFYMDFSEMKGAQTFCTLYTMLSYFYPLFDSVPYLKLSGLKGSAKTKLCLLFALLGFNPLMAVSMTPAIIYRTIQDTRGLLIIDEGENYQFPDELRIEIISILNSGWQSSGFVSRMDMDGRRKKRIKFSTYGPKIIGAISTMIETLADRAYEIMLLKTMDIKKANREVSPRDTSLAAIRDSHYILLMNFWREVREIASSITNNDELAGREWDKARPLMVLAEFVDSHLPEEERYVRRELGEFIREQRKEKEADESDSIEMLILQELAEEVKRIIGEEDAIDEKGSPVFSQKKARKAVSIHLNILAAKVAVEDGYDPEKKNYNSRSYNKKVSKKLRDMGLLNNKRKSHESTVFDVTLEKVVTAWIRLTGTSSAISAISVSSAISAISAKKEEKDREEKADEADEADITEQKEGVVGSESSSACLSLAEAKKCFITCRVEFKTTRRKGIDSISTIPTFVLEKSAPELIQKLRAGNWQDIESYDRNRSFWSPKEALN